MKAEKKANKAQAKEFLNIFLPSVRKFLKDENKVQWNEEGSNVTAVIENEDLFFTVTFKNAL